MNLGCPKALYCCTTCLFNGKLSKNVNFVVAIHTNQHIKEAISINRLGVSASREFIRCPARQINKTFRLCIVDQLTKRGENRYSKGIQNYMKVESQLRKTRSAVFKDLVC